MKRVTGLRRVAMAMGLVAGVGCAATYAADVEQEKELAWLPSAASNQGSHSFRLGGAAPSTVQAPQYEAKDFSSLLGMKGFSHKALDTHFKLYQGYVKNTNLLLSELHKSLVDGAEKAPQVAELRRRLGWEFNGMRLHELYFSNLGGTERMPTTGALREKIEMDFGSVYMWQEEFRALGSMRGIGWVVMFLDPVSGRLINAWINEHDVGHLTGAAPLLIMDVFEHAYMIDYNLDRAGYMDAFFSNIDWDVVKDRFLKASQYVAAPEEG